MKTIRLGVFDEETGKKYVKKVEIGFYNPSGPLKTFFTTPKMTNINNVKYYTTSISVQTKESDVNETLKLGTTILDLIESGNNETKIYVMKNAEERTENYLNTTVAVDSFKNMRYYIGNNGISQAFNSINLERENANIRMAYYYTIIDNIQVEFVGWVCTRPTGETDDNGIPIVIITGVFVDYNFWEKGELPPFGDPTPSGAIGGYGTHDDTSDDFPIPDNIINGVYASIFSNANGKIQIYTLDSSAYSAFLGKIYTNDFWQYWQNTIFNPLDGIYSCIRVPFNELALTRSAVAKINVSNTELEILSGAYRVTGGFVQDENIVSDYAIEEYFGSYLDYTPHTTCELYIPFYGTVNININEIMGGSISIVRRNNYINGDFVVFVQCTNRFGVVVTHAYSGNAAMTLPITAGNNGGPNRIIDLVQGVANVALGNYVGGAMNAVNAITEKGYASTVQKLSGGAGWSASHDFALIIHRLCESNPEKYSEIKQRPADMFVKLSDLSGEYSIEKQNLDIHDKNITDEEITEIENILQGGAIF